jgi:hypothetical protein
VNRLKVGVCSSAISVETPFAHVAIHASKAIGSKALNLHCVLWQTT